MTNLTTVGRYDIIKELGQGGMATVLLALLFFAGQMFLGNSSTAEREQQR